MKGRPLSMSPQRNIPATLTCQGWGQDLLFGWVQSGGLPGGWSRTRTQNRGAWGISGAFSSPRCCSSWTLCWRSPLLSKCQSHKSSVVKNDARICSSRELVEWLRRQTSLERLTLRCAMCIEKGARPCAIPPSMGVALGFFNRDWMFWVWQGR